MARLVVGFGCVLVLLGIQVLGIWAATTPQPAAPSGGGSGTGSGTGSGNGSGGGNGAAVLNQTFVPLLAALVLVKALWVR